MSLKFEIQPAANPTPEQERTAKLADPGFGRIFTDHMAIVRYNQAKGWHNARVESRANFPLDPAEKLKGIRMGNQLKYADRRNSPCVIIQGSDEKARGEIQIKDLIEGARAAAAIASNQEWRETRPAQFSCAESEIVTKVREVLARHDVKWG